MKLPALRTLPAPRRDRGAALLIILTIIGLGAAFLLVSALTRATHRIEADKKTAAALAQAKDALIGYAISPTASGQRPGDLLRPDYFAATESPPNYDGNADGGCLDVSSIPSGIPLINNGANMRCLGRLPWVSLGISYGNTPENDPAGLMPWYAVSANLVDPTCLSFLNSDTATLPTPTVTNNVYTLTCASPAQLPHPWLTVRDAKGNVVSNRVAAVIIIPGMALAGQSRPASPNLAGASQYLDTITVPAGCSAPCVPGTYSNADMDNDFIQAFSSDTFNDKLLFITIDELIAAIAKRVAKEAGNALAAFYNTCGFYPRPVNFSTSACYTSPCNSDPSQIQGRLPYDPKVTGATQANWTLPTWFLGNRWDSVLYYAVSNGFVSGGNGSTLITVDGSATARALFFTPAINTPTINRAANPTNLSYYLLAAENTNLDTLFSFSGANEKGYMRTNDFSSHTPSNPNPICTVGGPTQATFASNFGSFQPYGAGVATNPVTQTVTVTSAAGSSGGCFWFPTAIPLNGKTLRAYYNFAFTNADPSGGPDLGNGFTLSFLRGDVGAPTACGLESDLGALNPSTTWGNVSLFVETDVRVTPADNDPAGNHTAIMANGNLAHSAANGNVTSACNGTAQGCYYPLVPNRFEESPAPLAHNQRVEIHTGFSDASCTGTIAGGAYAEVKIWSDCLVCGDTSADFFSTATARRCLFLDPAMNNFYVGFTGGFSSTGGGQGVSIQNFDLRTQ